MNLIFYKTGFDITKNGMYEHIDAYLSTLTSVAEFADYKYVEPALETRIKLPIFTSHMALKGNIGDYMVAYDKEMDDKYYYYVTGCKWRAKETVEVTLALDTLTTFQDRINASLTNESHITRKFKDRFYVTRTLDTTKMVVDDFSEDFSSVPMVRQEVTELNPSASTKKWTLVYMTKYSSSVEDIANNPVTIYALPSDSTKINTTRNGEITWDSSSIESGAVYATTYTEAGAKTFKFVPSDGSGEQTVTMDPTECTWLIVFNSKDDNYLWVKYMSRAGLSTNDKYIHVFKVDSFTWVDFDKCYQMTSKYQFVHDIPEGRNAGIGEYPWEGWLDTSSPRYLNAGETYSSLLTFDQWYESNKTDSRIVKIRELPYAPFQESYSNSTLNLPSNWVYENKQLKFTGTSFAKYTLLTRSMLQPVKLSKEDIVDTTPSIERETKLYNSSFYGDKFVYDTNTWVAQWEKGNPKLGYLNNMSISLVYKVSDGIDNTSIITIADSFEYDSDFGQCMVIDKNTDKPFFTNDYINYVRYGKYYDEKAAGWNVGSSVVSGVGSILTSVSSAAFAGNAIAGMAAGTVTGGGVGALVGLGVGLVTTAASLAKTCLTYRDSINSKIDAYTHQASSVNGTSDISIFNVYSGNKILNIIYDTRADVKQMLYQYFRQFGYACDEYGLPKASRRYVDYFQVEPVFQGDFMWNDFLEDVKQRMQLGYRVYHLVDNTYDLTLSKENWEDTLWEWAH